MLFVSLPIQTPPPPRRKGTAGAAENRGGVERPASAIADAFPIWIAAVSHGQVECRSTGTLHATLVRDSRGLGPLTPPALPVVLMILNPDNRTIDKGHLQSPARVTWRAGLNAEHNGKGRCRVLCAARHAVASPGCRSGQREGAISWGGGLLLGLCHPGQTRARKATREGRGGEEEKKATPCDGRAIGDGAHRQVTGGSFLFFPFLFYFGRPVGQRMIGFGRCPTGRLGRGQKRKDGGGGRGSGRNGRLENDEKKTEAEHALGKDHEDHFEKPQAILTDAILGTWSRSTTARDAARSPSHSSFVCLRPAASGPGARLAANRGRALSRNLVWDAAARASGRWGPLD